MQKLSVKLFWNSQYKTLHYEGKIIRLTKSETSIFNTLAKNINYPVTSEELFYSIEDNYEKEFHSHSIRMMISKIRKKIPVEIIENVYGSKYIIRQNKIHQVIQDELNDYLYTILDQMVTGVVITDPHQEDNPVIYVNQKFIDTYHYTEDEILGHNCRILQGEHRDQDQIKLIKEAIQKQESITTQLINYTKENEPINIELTISPIFNKTTKDILYFLGLQRVL